MAKTYTYVDQTGGSKTFEGDDDSNVALKSLPTDADSHSGIFAGPVSVLSSNAGKDALTSAQDQHAEDMARTNANGSSTQTKSKDKKNSGVTTYTYDEIKNLGIDMNNVDYDPETTSFRMKSESEIQTPEMLEKNEILKQSKKDMDEISSIFDKQMRMMDSATAAVIESLHGTYAQRAKEQAEMNKRQLAETNTFGIRTGGSRYAGEVNQGILNAEERAGMERLDKIAAAQAAAVAQAQQALADKKYSIFVDKRNEVSKLKKEAQDRIIKLQEAAQKKKEADTKAKIQASRDSAIAGILKQGVTDPVKILDFLNYKEDGTPTGGDFTAKEVADTVKSLAPEGNIKSLSGETRNYFILKDIPGALPKSITSLPEDQQLTAYLKLQKTMAKAASTTKSPNPKPTDPSKAPTTVISKMTQFLSSIMGEDNYIDPHEYQNQYNSWIQSGYSADSFLKNFPPDRYVNPSHDWDYEAYLPQYLRPKKGKASSTSQAGTP